MTIRQYALASCMPLLAGCEGIQSALDPRSPDAERIATLTWVLFGAGTLIFVFVMALTACAMTRPAALGRFAGNRLIVAGGVLFPCVTLLATLIYSLVVSAAMSDPSAEAVTIEVIGHQWWWEVRYVGDDADVAFTTANEIRIPSGRPVRARIGAADVIHSFWVPNLAGKIDMIPGHEHELPFQAATPGKFRGQCAEYCGGPHARMAFYVVAQDPAEFATWFRSERQPAREPRTATSQRGSELFLSSGCGACHTIRGTAAAGRLGPDLTHVGSRVSIGASMMENNIDTLAQWIADNQRIKPGNRMVAYDTLPGEDIRAIAAYLHGLE